MTTGPSPIFRLRAASVGIFIVVIFVAAGFPSLTFAQNVTTRQYGNARTGVQSQESILTPSNVNSTSFGKLFSLPVSGHVYAQPLYMAGLTMADGTTHNVLFVATEEDAVYAFDADGNNPAQGYLWRDSLLPAGETVVSWNDVNTGDIYPEIGITSTPVIDPSTGTIYVVAKSKTTSGTVQFFQRIHALSLADGTEKFNGPTVIQATVPGTADGTGTISFNPLLGNQRAGLLLAPTPNGPSPASIFIAWASHGDNGPYHGWVISYNAADVSQQTGVWTNTPNGTRGGIWQSGGALSTDGNGHIFVAAGNGAFDANAGGPDYGNSVVSLSLNGTTLAPTTFFTPADQNSAADNDMGTSSVVLLPAQGGAIPDLAVVCEKSGNIYLLNADNMGGYSASEASVQNFNIGYSILTSPAFFNNVLYLAGEGGPLSAWTFDPVAQRFSTSPATTSSATFGCDDCGGAGTTPVISANGTSNAIVWALDNSGRENTPAILRAYDPLNLQNVFYSSDQAANNRDAAAIAVKFTSPVVANGHVYVGGVGAITVYGEFGATPTVGITATPTAIAEGGSSTLAITATGATTITVTGTDGSSFTVPSTGGTQTVTPTATTTYTATATGSSGGSVSASVSVNVSTTGGCLPSSPGVAICAPANNASTGSTVTITAGALAGSGYMAAVRGYIDNVAVFTVSNPSATASMQVTQTATVTPGYHQLVVVGYPSTGGYVQGSSSFTTSVPGVTVTISASPTSIAPGGSSALSVGATNATTVKVTGSDGSSFTLASTGGTQTVTPTATTTYTATATGAGTNATATATVTVVSSSGGCLPSAPGVSICAPANNATTGSTVTITAGALSPNGSMAAIRVYIDNVAVFTVNNSSATNSLQFTQTTNVTPGYHQLVVVGYPTSGGYVLGSSGFTASATTGGCLPSAPGVSICAPANNATTGSTVTITAGALAATGYMAAIRAYIDNVAVFTANNPSATNSFQVTQTANVSSGSHQLVVVGYPSTGGYVLGSSNFTASGATGCAPATTGAIICSPANNATVSSQVQISAGATTSSGYIAAIRVYVDNIAQTIVNNPQQTSSFSINQAISMTAGRHNVVVVCYQSNGGALDAIETITVD